MDRITWIIPYYEAPKTLTIQLINWMSLSPFVKSNLSIFLIDDGSPDNPALSLVQSFWSELNSIRDFRVYRVLEDKPWNNHGCRNLGAYLAEDPWLLMTDVKHMVSSSSLEALIRMEKKEDEFYVFPCADCGYLLEKGLQLVWRTNKDGIPRRKDHPNTFLVHRRSFWETGGYDEDYCGTHGGDGPFMRSLEKVCRRVFVDEASCIRIWPRLVEDSQALVATRKEYNELYLRLRQVKTRSGDTQSRNPIRFDWRREL